MHILQCELNQLATYLLEIKGNEAVCDASKVLQHLKAVLLCLQLSGDHLEAGMVSQLCDTTSARI